jgi:hypothetical protein
MASGHHGPSAIAEDLVGLVEPGAKLAFSL